MNSFTDSDNDDFSPQNSNLKGKNGFNVSPSSMLDGKHRSRAANNNNRSLNSSRMTGTQELSIHEGM